MDASRFAAVDVVVVDVELELEVVAFELPCGVGDTLAGRIPFCRSKSTTSRKINSEEIYRKTRII